MAISLFRSERDEWIRSRVESPTIALSVIMTVISFHCRITGLTFSPCKVSSRLASVFAATASLGPRSSRPGHGFEIGGQADGMTATAAAGFWVFALGGFLVHLGLLELRFQIGDAHHDIPLQGKR